MTPVSFGYSTPHQFYETIAYHPLAFFYAVDRETVFGQHHIQ